MTFWTDERVEELRRLAPNHTATEIARIMGAPSRNAIIGKLARIKVALNPDWPRGQARPKIPAVPRRAISLAVASQASRVQIPTPQPCQPLPEPACEPIPKTAVTLADLTQDACRWPLWGEATPSNERRFCGGMAINGLPYCVHHARIAYTGQERATLPMRRAG